MNTVSASAVPTVVSVIGPERDKVAAVAATLQERVPGRRFVVGAGPDTAGGVIAVTAGKDSKDSKDTAIVRAVRDAMGGCVVYTGGELTALSAEPGVTVVPWDGDAADRRNIDRLAAAVTDRWIDVPRWVSDARRADADRIDRVRVAVRLTAERHASDLLEPGGQADVGGCSTRCSGPGCAAPCWSTVWSGRTCRNHRPRPGRHRCPAVTVSVNCWSSWRPAVQDSPPLSRWVGWRDR
ncbi:hypothetical protein [Corynebacterium variabile]|uniref:hypothetical protein n=1 Tax=Corynebacterium variabile TaxID=1727 RepID=UPI0028A242CD|nr:hypothetical protein [Corynebacterium variabile]